MIVELGTNDGGSALWLADQLQVLCGGGHVVTVDTTLSDLADGRVTPICGDLREVVHLVRPYLPGRRVMVIDDSAHTYDVTLASLRLYAPFVSTGCYFVVEDTIVDTDLSIWPNVTGAGKAVDTYLAEDERFSREDMDLYGLTMHMGGWLKAIA
jgi:cephalosporin hydroxylase